MVEELAKRGWQLNYILNTHHHGDHVGANLKLKDRFGCKVVGCRHDQRRIPGVDILVSEGDSVALGASKAEVIETPGHTSGHIVYWFNGSGNLFCGDTLFSLGCGRLFEGSAMQMWTSLKKLKALPDTALVYCAHEYTQSNAAFCLDLEPGNEELKRFAKSIDDKRRQGLPTVPSSLGEEKRFNPFLRADDSGLLASLGVSAQEPAEVFAMIRQRKDNF